MFRENGQKWWQNNTEFEEAIYWNVLNWDPLRAFCFISKSSITEEETYKLL